MVRGSNWNAFLMIFNLIENIRRTISEILTYSPFNFNKNWRN